MDKINKKIPKIIVILGPTSSSKSKTAVKLAKKFNGEIISADSRQVYKKMNIGTGKITKKEMRNIPHYCLDIVSPQKRFTVLDFKKHAERAIKNILSRGKLPIICGGTGFYISALTGDIKIPEIKPNWKLRKQLEKKSTKQLFAMLKKLNPKRAQNIDPQNPRRLIRAIEIARNANCQLTTDNRNNKPSLNNMNFLQIGIKLPEKILKEKIEKRIKKMISHGLIEEIKKLRNFGISWKRLYEMGFEYKYPAMFLQNKINKKEMIEKMIIENNRYAKRQMTWFKKYAPKTYWIKSPNIKQTEKLVKKFI